MEARYPTTTFILIIVVCALLLAPVLSDILSMRNADGEVDQSKLSPETQKLVQEQYENFMKQRREEKERNKKQQEQPPPEPKTMVPPRKGRSPKALGITRPLDSAVDLSQQVALQVKLPGGPFYFGTQMTIDKKGKIGPVVFKDGASIRKKTSVKMFSIDVDCVTNEQFAAFVQDTNYETEAELFGWSFVLESLASKQTIEDTDSEEGMGRVKNAVHWLAVKEASWKHPYGIDSSIHESANLPVVHVSHTDAEEYCAWASGPKSAGRNLRLPTEKEWEYAARGGLVNASFTWGNNFKAKHMNIWEGKFPSQNAKDDGFHGLAPTRSFPPNNFGLYNMLGNVWEWTKGGTPERRILRGGSFIDSVDGSFNHAVRVSTRQENTADSAGINIGFRCASSESGTSHASPAGSSTGTGGTAGESATKENAHNSDTSAGKPKAVRHGKQQTVNVDADHIIEL